MRGHLGTRRVLARNMYEGLVIMEGCVKVDIVKATEVARLTALRARARATRTTPMLTTTECKQ